MTPEQIEEMKRDRANDSPRSWRVIGAESPDGQEWLGVGVAEESCDEFVWFEFDPEQDIPRARRIARVPAMEAQILAQQAEIDRLRAKVEAGERRDMAALSGALYDAMQRHLKVTEHGDIEGICKARDAALAAYREAGHE